MFDHDDVTQECEVAKLEGVTPSRAIVKRRLLRSRDHRGGRAVYQATASQLRSAEARCDPGLALIDLHGLPERTLAVAELRAGGAGWGEVEVALGISRRELDVERARLREVLL